MEVILIKNGAPRIFLVAHDGIDEGFLQLLDGGTVKLINNKKIEEELILSCGLLIEPATVEKKAGEKKEWWWFKIFKNI